jgi:hypothetical protein
MYDQTCVIFRSVILYLLRICCITSTKDHSNPLPELVPPPQSSFELKHCIDRLGNLKKAIYVRDYLYKVNSEESLSVPSRGFEFISL